MWISKTESCPQLRVCECRMRRMDEHVCVCMLKYQVEFSEENNIGLLFDCVKPAPWW